MKQALLILSLLISMPALASHHHHSSISMVSADVSSKIDRFATRMAVEYQFNKQEVHDFLVRTEPNMEVFKFFNRRAKKNFTPEELEELKLLAALRIQHGVEFWSANQKALEKAERTYGVPAEIIVGLIGIETSYGSYLGKFKEHQVLVTLAFYGNHRSSYFQNELENFLVLSREFGWDKTNIPCSYAGAVGIPQFMPDNMKPYAVDFDGDGQIDLMNPADAIGSVASFLSQHGWVKGQPIATRANSRIKGRTFVLRTLPGPAPTIWTKQKNFSVIRAYNPLDSYAMAIFILATKVKDVKDHQLEPINIDPVQILDPPDDIVSDSHDDK